MRFNIVYILITAVILISCDNIKTVEIWTDRPELALYGEFFNTIQSQYKVSVKYAEYPVSALSRSNSPDIIVASWLKNSSTGAYFRSLNDLFRADKLSRNVFYPRLLAVGRIDRNQYLLPVSFNIPALIFSKDREQDLSNQFTIGFNEIKTLSKSFNAVSRGVYTRLGFSPIWNDNFLLATSILSDVSFREASPLAWDSAALERSMVFINEWTNEVNTSIQADEEFTFKYFFEPPEKLLQSGRILFSYKESNELFLWSEESKNNLDFRWIMENEQIPITDNSVYLGIPKWSKSWQTAGEFIVWFFKVENQRLLLDYSRVNRINETIFGICGGFSSLSPVTEQVYPLFYPELLGRMPPYDNFMYPNILPANWIDIKERVVLPYLHDRVRHTIASDIYPLERRLSDWMRMNR